MVWTNPRQKKISTEMYQFLEHQEILNIVGHVFGMISYILFQVSVTRVLSASSERRRPKSAAKGSGQVELYILSDELDDVAKTINKLKTEMAHTCIKAFLKPHVYMINIAWAPRYVLFEPEHVRKRTIWVPTRSDTNRAVESQK